MSRAFRKLNLSTLFACLSFLIGSMPADVSAGRGQMTQDDNAIEKIRFGSEGVEIHLYSSRDFPVRALPPVLHIGSVSFQRSYNPPDGDLHRLIFLLTRNAYARLKPGDPVLVLYGQGMSPRERWEFGAFDKR
jgi:hypothetical protein